MNTICKIKYNACSKDDNMTQREAKCYTAKEAKHRALFCITEVKQCLK